jgi:hypothetical protein
MNNLLAVPIENFVNFFQYPFLTSSTQKYFGLVLLGVTKIGHLLSLSPQPGSPSLEGWEMIKILYSMAMYFELVSFLFWSTEGHFFWKGIII